ncbi:Hypothetical predicted protein [Lecanosticta acicola]|uniref:Uncharacterized protein n=1 Tax=Lecanosticta acicola TaxID=111012 RepID=A0AAI8YZE7_9PEZI|nr:Hypothetical predicted protein [Lecanosticta acicola]
MASLTPDPSKYNTPTAADYYCLRDLYDFYKANGIRPIVVDADDYMTGGAFVRHLCSKRPGLHPELAVISWPKTTEKEQRETNPHLVVIHNILNSKSLVPERASKDINLPAEFGEKGADFFDKVSSRAATAEKRGF